MKSLKAFLFCFALGGCTAAQLTTASTDLNAFAMVLNAAATDLPTACADLSIGINQAQQTSNLPASIANSLATANQKYSSYCQQGAAVVVATSVAVNDINALIQAWQKAAAANGAS